MNRGSIKFGARGFRYGFTLVELMIAMSVGLVLTGSVVYLLWQSAREEQRGYSDMTVEEKAYVLEANLTSFLRGSSSGYGMTASPTNQFYTGTNFSGYTTIYLWQPNTNGSAFTEGKISADLTNGVVIFTPNISVPAATTVWFTNSANAVLRKLYFFPSLNFDGSANNSLVNVVFQMDDNGFSQQNSTNNVANIFRSFSVQMRCD